VFDYIWFIFIILYNTMGMSHLKAVRQLFMVLTASSKTRNTRHLTSGNQLFLFRNLVLYTILETAIKHLVCTKSTFNTEEEELCFP
jgi:hypothetical protein